MGKLEKAGVGIVVALLGVILLVALLGGDENTNATMTAGAQAPAETPALSAERHVDGTTPGAVVEAKDLPAATSVVVPDTATGQVPVATPIVENVSAANVPAATPNATPVAAPTTELAAAAPATTREVTVKNGDSLWKIAAREVRAKDVDAYIREMRALNGLGENARLKVGSKLKVPARAAEGVAASTETPVSATNTAGPFEPAKPVVAIEEHVSAGATLREYTVKKGDALALIAKRECGSEKAVKAIMTLNQLKDGNVLKIGQKLKLPARGQ
jgi:LysM repeat protein